MLYNGDEMMKPEATGGVTLNYTYDGDGNRLEKSNGKLYWYGAGTEILDESDLSGNFTTEYVFFAGKRIAMRTVSTGTIYYYEADMLGSSRTIVQAGQTSPCYDADFLPFGVDRFAVAHKEVNDVTSTCTTAYKFEGRVSGFAHANPELNKERDTETSNVDRCAVARVSDFGARYYSNFFGRWLSPDWSAVPAPIPYANLTNPQTLNIYAMVSDNPESFADLDGHENGCPTNKTMSGNGQCQTSPSNGIHDPKESPCQKDHKSDCANQTNTGAKQQPDQSTANQDNQKKANQLVLRPHTTKPRVYPGVYQEVADYQLGRTDAKGNFIPLSDKEASKHKVKLDETMVGGTADHCSGQPQCTQRGGFADLMQVGGGSSYAVIKHFSVDGKPIQVYDHGTEKTYDFVRVDASAKNPANPFVFSYGNDK